MNSQDDRTEYSWLEIKLSDSPENGSWTSRSARSSRRTHPLDES